MRPGLHNLAQTAATDKQVPGWDNANGLWVPRNTVHSIVQGTNVTVDNTDPFNPVVASTGGGGGGSTIKDRQWTAAAGVTSIDEFNDSVLDSAWGRVDVSGGTARAVWTEDADSLSVAQVGGDAAAELHAMMRPVSGAGGSMAVGDAFLTAVRMTGPTGTAYTMAALILASGNAYGAGTQVLALQWATTTVGAMTIDMRPWTSYSTDPGGAVSGLNVPFGALLYVRLALIASNTWRRDFSADGVTWIKGSATLTNSLVPTHVGVGTSSYGTSTKGMASFEFLRRMSGVT